MVDQYVLKSFFERNRRGRAPFMRIAGSQLAIFIEMVFINISPVRIVMFAKMTKNNVGGFLKFFLSGEDVDTLQKDLFILQLLADILAGQFPVKNVIGNPHFKQAIFPTDQLVADQVMVIIPDRQFPDNKIIHRQMFILQNGHGSDSLCKTS